MIESKPVRPQNPGDPREYLLNQGHTSKLAEPYSYFNIILWRFTIAIFQKNAKKRK